MLSLRGSGIGTEQLRSRYRNKVEVYLEGQEDVAIYKNYWFAGFADKVDFKQAQDSPARLPGCKGVEAAVQHQRRAGVNAYGVVDRDAIDDVAVRFETSDETFLRANFGRNPYVYYTVRFELENYLVDSELWEEERVEVLLGHGRRQTAQVEEELLAHCQALIPHAAANALKHKKGDKKIGDGFATEANNMAELEAKLFEGPLAGLTEADLDEYHQLFRKINSFDQPDQPNISRVHLLCRAIHGKALILRFCLRNRIKSDIRLRVARQLRDKVPQELATRIQRWATV